MELWNEYHRITELDYEAVYRIWAVLAFENLTMYDGNIEIVLRIQVWD
jgi:hypothetical protein